MSPMNWLARVNLAIGAVFAVGAPRAARVCASIRRSHARTAAFAAVGRRMDGRSPCARTRPPKIVPLRRARMHSEFLPPSVPSYAATQNFPRLRENHPD